MELNKETAYILEIKEILQKARQKAYTAINSAMVEAYWLIGKRIVEEEQNGQDRAKYGDKILKTLSRELTQEFGKGFSTTNLKNFRKFYIEFTGIEKGQTVSDHFAEKNQPNLFKNSESQIWQTVSANLSWSHYERLIRLENKEARNYYMVEAINQNWSVRTLDRNISTLYYHRLISSHKKSNRWEWKDVIMI